MIVWFSLITVWIIYLLAMKYHIKESWFNHTPNQNFNTIEIFRGFVETETKKYHLNAIDNDYVTNVA